jgi:hypothetical protein
VRARLLTALIIIGAIAGAFNVGLRYGVITMLALSAMGLACGLLSRRAEREKSVSDNPAQPHR